MRYGYQINWANAYYNDNLDDSSSLLLQNGLPYLLSTI